jgi:hypothetical protein
MSEITYSRLVPADLERIGEIDRTERIDALYVQHGNRLDRRFGDFSAPAWLTEGEGEHSVAHQSAESSGISPRAELHWERLRMANSWRLGLSGRTSGRESRSSPSST